MVNLNRLRWLVVIALIGSPLAARSVAAQAAPAPAGADKGAAVYAAQKCSMCHALDGKGNAKGALDAVGSKLKADEIRQWIVTPADMAAKAKSERKPAMKAFPNLAKDDLDALVAFLASKMK